MSGLQAESPDVTSDGEISRKRFITRTTAAFAVAGVAFVAPEIKTMETADASTITSPPPQPPSTEETPPVEVAPEKPKTTEDLPRTGANIENEMKLAILLGAAGVPMAVWGAMKPKAIESPAIPTE